jgi:hypothetical protein
VFLWPGKQGTSFHADRKRALSLVAQLPWVQGVGRSNRPASTNGNKPFICNAGFRPG